jgi:hypothetical protein
MVDGALEAGFFGCSKTTRPARRRPYCGEVAEWLKAHAWKVCLRQKRNAGSNPALSASDLL